MAAARPVRRRTRLNINDIAARTGLSKATVSRVINGKSWVAEQTRARVLAALNDMGYVPNRLATGLSTGFSHQLGLMIGEQHDPTSMAAMQGALAAAAAADYTMVVYMARDAAEHGRIFTDIMAGGGVDGCLLLYPARGDEALVRRLWDDGLPLVLIDPQAAIEGIPSVFPDGFSDGYLSTRHLIDLGHRRIALSTDELAWQYADLYVAGYHAALAEAGIPVASEGDLVVRALYGHNAFDGGYATMQRWLALPQPPTGLCFHSDMAAMGGLAAARDGGLRVPDDVSIVAYDDTEMTRWIKPTLTALQGRRADMACRACEMLLALIRGEDVPVQPQLITTDLVIRQSTAAVPARGAV